MRDTVARWGFCLALGLGSLGASSLAQAASRNRICALALWNDDDVRRREMLREVFASGVPLSPAEALDLDLRSQTDRDPAIQSLARQPPVEIEGSDFLRVTGYTRRKSFWGDRANALMHYFNHAFRTEYRLYLELIAANDPHPGVQREAQNFLDAYIAETLDSAAVMTKFHPSLAHWGAPLSPSPHLDEVLAKHKRIAESPGWEQEAMVDPEERHAEARREEVVTALSEHLHARGVHFVTFGPGPKVELKGDTGTALGRLAMWFNKKFPHAILQFDPSDAYQGVVDAPYVGPSALTLPLSAARDPSVLPANLPGWVAAFKAQYQMAQTVQTPFAGQVLIPYDGPSEDLSSAAERRALPLANLLMGKFDLRRAWQGVREVADLSASDSRRENAELLLNLVIEEKFAELRRVSEAVTRASALNVQWGLPEHEGSDPLPNGAVAYVIENASRATLNRFYPWVGVVILANGEPLLEMPVVNVRTKDNPILFRALATQIQKLNLAVLDIERELRRSQNILAQFRELSSGIERRALLMTLSTVEDPVEMDDFNE